MILMSDGTTNTDSHIGKESTKISWAYRAPSVFIKAEKRKSEKVKCRPRRCDGKFRQFILSIIFNFPPLNPSWQQQYSKLHTHDRTLFWVSIIITLIHITLWTHWTQNFYVDEKNKRYDKSKRYFSFIQMT